MYQWGDNASSPRGLFGVQGKGWNSSENQNQEPGLTLRTTPVVTAMFSASSTVLVATVLTLVTTASLTALACSLVFSATVGGLWLALALTLPHSGLACPSQA